MNLSPDGVWRPAEDGAGDLNILAGDIRGVVWCFLVGVLIREQVALADDDPGKDSRLDPEPAPPIFFGVMTPPEEKEFLAPAILSVRDADKKEDEDVASTGAAAPPRTLVAEDVFRLRDRRDVSSLVEDKRSLSIGGPHGNWLPLMVVTNVAGLCFFPDSGFLQFYRKKNFQV